MVAVVPGVASLGQVLSFVELYVYTSTYNQAGNWCFCLNVT